MSSFSLHFKEGDTKQIQRWVEYVRALDFVKDVEEKKEIAPFLSADEIRRQYPGSWVLLSDSKAEGVRVLGGRVILHNTNKHQLALQGRELVKQHKDVRHFYTSDMSHQKHIGIIVRKKNLPK